MVLGLARHEDGRRMIEALLDVPAQIAVGDDADQFAAVIGHADHAEALFATSRR